MPEHELYAHGQRTGRIAKGFVTRCGCPEGLGGGQPAPTRRECTGSAASAQNPAKSPEVRRGESNPLYVHDHIGEAGVHQSVTKHMHIGEWVHPV